VQYQVLILSADDGFARMLELEFSMLQMSVSFSFAWQEGASAQVVLLDLDTAALPPQNQYEHLIGFTRGAVSLVGDAGRQCSMVLRRPFEMRLLRREVLSCLHGQSAHYETDHSPKTIVKPIKSAIDVKKMLSPDGRRLVYEEKSITLGPHESAVMKCLLEQPGTPVSRDILSRAIGESRTNKTDVYICFLRRKVEAAGLPCRVRTIRNYGYQLDIGSP